MREEHVRVSGHIAGIWDIDPVHSHVGFSARHLMVSKVHGRFTRFEGQIVTGANPAESSATATIDTTSLDTGNAQRDEDIKGENFLSVADYPAMTYRSTGIHPRGDGYRLDGELTIKGVTRPVVLELQVNGFGPDPYGATRAGFSASGEINREDFGLAANMTLPGGGLVVSREIQLMIEVEAALRRVGQE
ncbi:MAG TPA: YceI family protein [Streptosporangiaceae bacterium]|nr:YceI family protein [Streptosporangiaceae bacterium]